MKSRWTNSEIFQKLYPIRRYTNVHFGLKRVMPIPRGATWGSWFRKQENEAKTRRELKVCDEPRVLGVESKRGCDPPHEGVLARYRFNARSAIGRCRVPFPRGLHRHRPTTVGSTAACRPSARFCDARAEKGEISPILVITQPATSAGPAAKKLISFSPTN